MSETTAALILLPAVLWPLLLAGAVGFDITRAAVLRLAPWAALPALVTAAVPTSTSLQLPGVMLGGALALDATGRVFLLLSAILWLAAGWLARAQLDAYGAGRFAVLMLLAMAGGFALPLAADVLSFFAAGTLAAYALYGLLVHQAGASAHAPARVLVVLLVTSDLLVFELLLMLGQTAGSVDFTSLRQAVAASEERGIVLGLLIAGFGIKAGLVGVHFWLAPVFLVALPAVRPALIGTLLAAGSLGWLRLLPLGEVHWPGTGILLQWLAWFTLGYAVLVGLMQARFRATMAYAASALAGLWMALLGAALNYPQAWDGLADAVPVAVLQSGLALAALLLLDPRMGGSARAGLHYLLPGVMWIAVLLLVTAPLGIAGSLAEMDGMVTLQVSWATAAIAFLAVRGLLSDTCAIEGPRRNKPPTATTLPVAGGLTTAALLAAAYNLNALSSTGLWPIALAVPPAAFAAWLSVERLVPRLPVLPPGDLLTPIGNRLAAALEWTHRLVDRHLPPRRDAAMALARRLRSGVDWRRISGRLESLLNRWSAGLMFLLLMGLTAAWLGANQ